LRRLLFYYEVIYFYFRKISKRQKCRFFFARPQPVRKTRPEEISPVTGFCNKTKIIASERVIFLRFMEQYVKNPHSTTMKAEAPDYRLVPLSSGTFRIDVLKGRFTREDARSASHGKMRAGFPAVISVRNRDPGSFPPGRNRFLTRRKKKKCIRLPVQGVPVTWRSGSTSTPGRSGSGFTPVTNGPL